MQFNQKVLKLIAMITMIVDHTAVCFYYQLPYDTYTLMRNIGRLAFPIYILLAIEAVIHTHSKRNYLLRLLLLAFLSEIPFDLALFHSQTEWEFQNVIFTIFFGVSACMAFTEGINNWKESKPKSILFFALTALCLYLPYPCHTDYGAAGSIAIFAGYLIKRYTKLKEVPVKNICALLAAAVILVIKDGAPEAWSLATPVFGIPYNDKLGKLSKAEKWIYRFWYPAHLLLLWIIYYYTVYVNLPRVSVG